jgi:hypothetical protein
MIALRNFGWLPLAGVTAAAALGAVYLHHRSERRSERRFEHRRHQHGESRAAAFAALGDQPVSGCTHAPDTFTLSGDLDVGDLINWVGRFTCQSIVFDPRIVATGKKLYVLAPQPMAPAQAVETFHAALATVGLAAVPDGNVIRIVEAAAVAPEPSIPAICVATKIDDAAGQTLSAPVVVAQNGDQANVRIADPDRTLSLAITPHVYGGQIGLDVSYDERSRGAGGAWTTHTLSTHAVAVDRQPVALSLPDRHLVITPARMDVGPNRCSR